MASQPKPELVYFNGRGLAEMVRLVLTAAGIEFTEVDLTQREEFLALQPDLLFGQVPLLRIDGMNLVQSRAIVYHVAKKANLIGSNETDTTRAAMLFEGTRDFYQKFTGMGFTPDDEVKETIKKQAFPRYLPAFNKVLEQNGTGYLVGSSLTVADLGLFEVLLATVDYFGETAFADFDAIKRFYKIIGALPNVVTYLTKIRKPKTSSELMSTAKRVLNMP